MNLFDKVMDVFKVNEEYFDEEENYDEDVKPSKKQSFISDESIDDEESKGGLLKRRPKVVPIKRQTEVEFFKLTNFEKEVEICDCLLDGKVVVLNLEKMPFDAAQRIVDFVSGVVCAIGGDMRKISAYIFIITPISANLSGDFEEQVREGTDSKSATLGNRF